MYSVLNKNNKNKNKVLNKNQTLFSQHSKGKYIKRYLIRNKNKNQ